MVEKMKDGNAMEARPVVSSSASVREASTAMTTSSASVREASHFSRDAHAGDARSGSGVSFRSTPRSVRKRKRPVTSKSSASSA